MKEQVKKPYPLVIRGLSFLPLPGGGGERIQLGDRHDLANIWDRPWNLCRRSWRPDPTRCLQIPVPLHRRLSHPTRWNLVSYTHSVNTLSCPFSDCSLIRINSKDNVLFQWILGEFYNGDAEDWGSRCMEASFLRSDRLREFRPPRSLLVNCESEYNYFIGGDLASEGGVLPLGREQYNDFN